MENIVLYDSLCFLSKLSVSVKKMSSCLQRFTSRKESHLLSFYFEKFNQHTSTWSKISFFFRNTISKVPAKLLLKSVYFFFKNCNFMFFFQMVFKWLLNLPYINENHIFFSLSISIDWYQIWKSIDYRFTDWLRLV